MLYTQKRARSVRASSLLTSNFTAWDCVSLICVVFTHSRAAVCRRQGMQLSAADPRAFDTLQRSKSAPRRPSLKEESSERRSKSRRSSGERRTSFDEANTRVHPPPNPGGRTFYEKYVSVKGTDQALQRMCYGWSLYATACEYGNVASWTKGSRSARTDNFVMWCCCSHCCGSCLIQQQRQRLEIKLHRWHRERGAASTPHVIHTHDGGSVCTCQRSKQVAELCARWPDRAFPPQPRLVRGLTDEHSRGLPQCRCGAKLQDHPRLRGET